MQITLNKSTQPKKRGQHCKDEESKKSAGHLTSLCTGWYKRIEYLFGIHYHFFPGDKHIPASITISRHKYKNLPAATVSLTLFCQSKREQFEFWLLDLGL